MSIYKGEQQVLESANLKAYSTAPLGTILAFASDSVPSGYLLCDGSEVSRTLYKDLFDLIGTTYGEGDGLTTFNVPNLQDKFLQGSGTNVVGTTMEAGLPNITGGFYNYSYFNGTPSGAITTSVENRNQTQPGGDNMRTYIHYLLDASRSSSIYGSSETVQPPSIVINYIIKAKHVNEGIDTTNDIMMTITSTCASTTTSSIENIGIETDISSLIPANYKAVGIVAINTTHGDLCINSYNLTSGNTKWKVVVRNTHENAKTFTITATILLMKTSV